MAMLCVYGGECTGCMFCQNFDDTDTDVPFCDLPYEDPSEEDALEYIDED